MFKSKKNKIAEKYHLWYYNTEVWKQTHFLGVTCWKSVSDMWNYQEILWDLKPDLIIEFGANEGGTTLFFHTIMKTIKSDFKIFSVDIDDSKLDPRIRTLSEVEFSKSSSTDEKILNRLKEITGKKQMRIFAILDSDHSKKHVLGEMRLLREILTKGDYMVVEDSNINGHPVYPKWGEGPMEAILEYQKTYPDDYVSDTKREGKFGFTFAPAGFLIKNK